MRRRLFNLAAVVSLMLAIACAVEFFLSYRLTHVLTGLGQGYGVVATCKGGLLLGVESSASGTRWINVQTSEIDDVYSGVVGFHWQRNTNGTLIGIPLWLFAVVFGWIVVRLRRSVRGRPPGMCPRCGYDLRATPDRCPECGTLPTDSPEPLHNAPM